MAKQDTLQQIEKQRRWNAVMGFVKKTETSYPNLSTQLPALLLNVLGGKQIIPSDLVKKAGLIGDGIAVMGNWLNQSGFGGFNVDMGIGGGLRLGAAKFAIELVSGPLPSRRTFLAENSNVPESEMQGALVELSTVVRETLEVGFTPRQILAGLLIQSTARVGDERAETSVQTRNMINTASGGKLNEINKILNNWYRGQ